MAYKNELITCESCGHTQTYKIKKPNHILHLVMTCLTMGVWLIVWAAAAIEAWGTPSPKCGSCKQRI